MGAAQVDISNGDPNPTWAYTFTVGAGQTVIIGNYAVADGSIAASQADSARLAALPSTALECMSATDQSELGNFASAPTITEQPQSARGRPGHHGRPFGRGHRRRHRRDPDRPMATIHRRGRELDEHCRRDVAHAVRRDAGRDCRLPRRLPQRDRLDHQPGGQRDRKYPDPSDPPDTSEPPGPRRAFG